ncbi:MAG: acylneuraminate cytidylyltransferase family protein [Thermodesulfobacteriota bacterium]
MTIKNSSNDLKVLVVVHARGGSKRIPFKNILPLCGKPLIGYCLEASLASRYVDKVIVSTDHPEIKKVSESFGAEVPFLRPADISEDVASELVTIHALDFMEARDGVEYGIVITIQPTTPFLSTEDIDACIETLAAHPEADTVMTGRKMVELPTWARQIREDGISFNIFGRVSKGDQGISQTHPSFYVANGGAYVTWRRCIREQEVIIGPKTILHIMPFERSLDIDEPVDFFFAEKLQELMAAGGNVRDYVQAKAEELGRPSGGEGGR